MSDDASVPVSAIVRRLHAMVDRGEVEFAEAPEAEEEATAEDHAAARREHLLRRARIPARYLEDLAAVRETPALTRVRAWIGEGARAASVLVLAGAPGSGKTVAAAWALGELSGTFFAARSLVLSDAERGEAYRALTSCDLLVLDDLGSEYADRHGWSRSVIDAVIESRHADLRRTIVTTNLAGDAFARRYGQRVADRVRGAGCWYVVSGRSMRGGAT